MSKDLITKHKDAKANCWRCRCEGHYTLECNVKKMEEGEEIVKASVTSIKKKKRDDSVSSVVEEKAKIAATMSGAVEKKRIWEVDLKKEKHF
jgi:hypothetical protein